MSVGARKRRFNPFAGDRKLLVTYLAFMYGLRGAQPGTYVVLRASDLQELARALDTNWLSVKRQLETLMVDGHRRVERATRSRARRLAVPLAVAGLCAGGLLYQTHYRSMPSGAHAEAVRGIR
jgi:hypothetical protein